MNNTTPNEWPLDSVELTEKIEAKFTQHQLYSNFLYEDDNQVQFPAYGIPSFPLSNGGNIEYHFGRGDDFLTSSPIWGIAESNKNKLTLLEYLDRENDDLRSIKIVKRNRMVDFIQDFESKLRGDIDL